MFWCMDAANNSYRVNNLNWMSESCVNFIRLGLGCLIASVPSSYLPLSSLSSAILSLPTLFALLASISYKST